jgi:hypothetical protein
MDNIDNCSMSPRTEFESVMVSGGILIIGGRTLISGINTFRFNFIQWLDMDSTKKFDKLAGAIWDECICVDAFCCGVSWWWYLGESNK